MSDIDYVFYFTFKCVLCSRHSNPVAIYLIYEFISVSMVHSIVYMSEKIHGRVIGSYMMVF